MGAVWPFVSVELLAQPLFGEWVQNYRQGRGLTLREAAAVSGVPASTLAQVESGREVKLTTAVQLLRWAVPRTSSTG